MSKESDSEDDFMVDSIISTSNPGSQSTQIYQTSDTLPEFPFLSNRNVILRHKPELVSNNQCSKKRSYPSNSVSPSKLIKLKSVNSNWTVELPNNRMVRDDLCLNRTSTSSIFLLQPVHRVISSTASVTSSNNWNGNAYEINQMDEETESDETHSLESAPRSMLYNDPIMTSVVMDEEDRYSDTTISPMRNKPSTIPCCSRTSKSKPKSSSSFSTASTSFDCQKRVSSVDDNLLTSLRRDDYFEVPSEDVLLFNHQSSHNQRQHYSLPQQQRQHILPTIKISSSASASTKIHVARKNIKLSNSNYIKDQPIQFANNSYKESRTGRTAKLSKRKILPNKKPKSTAVLINTENRVSSLSQVQPRVLQSCMAQGDNINCSIGNKVDNGLYAHNLMICGSNSQRSNNNKLMAAHRNNMEIRKSSIDFTDKSQPQLDSTGSLLFSTTSLLQYSNQIDKMSAGDSSGIGDNTDCGLISLNTCGSDTFDDDDNGNDDVDDGYGGGSIDITNNVNNIVENRTNFITDAAIPNNGNCTSTTTTTTTTTTKRKHLLQFIIDLLKEGSPCVSWIDKSEKEFVIAQPDKLALLWASYKKNSKMTFDSLARSLRLYYAPRKLERITGKKHHYRILGNL